jgi:hypothetical protein
MRELATKTIFRTSGVLANPRLETEDPICCCSVQGQNSPATSIVKNSVTSTPFSEQSLMSIGSKAGRVARVFGVQLQNGILWEQLHFTLYVLLFAFIQISVSTFLSCCFGVSDVLMSVFQMELNDYPYFFLTEDERLCSMGQYCPGFPRVLYETLLHLGYDGDTLIYHCRLSMAHALDRCEVSVMIPFDSTEPWSGSIIGSEPDTDVEMMAHIALTSLCEDRLTAIAALPIALLPIRIQENPIWQQCLEDLSDLKGPHFHAGMTLLARYVLYLFILQHNTARTGMQQRMRLTAYEERATATSQKLERVRHENAILCSGARPNSEQDREL